jgi:hypothetical protein
MCTVLLPPGVNTIVFNKYIISYVIKYYVTNSSLITRHHTLGKSACSETVVEKVWCHIHLVHDYTLPRAERPCKYRAVQGSRSWPLPVQRGAGTRNQSVLWAALVYPQQ